MRDRLTLFENKSCEGNRAVKPIVPNWEASLPRVQPPALLKEGLKTHAVKKRNPLVMG